jgi:hypothetical protein
MRQVMYEERRKYRRAPVRASAALLRGGQPLGIFQAINLSTGGVLLEGMPPVSIEERVDVDVALPASTHRTEAVVLRRGQVRGTPAFALIFTAFSPGARHGIKAAVDGTLEEVGGAEVMIVCADALGCQELVSRTRESGLTCMTVSTKLAAIACLEENKHFKSVIVDDEIGREESDQLLAYLAEKQPHIRRVLSHRRAPGLGPTSPGPHAESAAAPHAVLAFPWAAESLRRALSRT